MHVSVVWRVHVWMMHCDDGAQNEGDGEWVVLYKAIRDDLLRGRVYIADILSDPGDKMKRNGATCGCLFKPVSSETEHTGY